MNKFMLLLAVLAGSVSATAQTGNKKPAPKPHPQTTAPVAAPQEPKKEIFMMADQMPEFNGDLNGFLNHALQYPAEARKRGAQGRVIMKFVVDETGRITDPVVERGADPALDAEALRVVKAMPPWKPGRQNGKPVAVLYRVPVTFRLQ